MAAAVLLSLLGTIASGQLARVPRTTSVLPASAQNLTVMTEPAFPGVSVTQPVAVVTPPGETDRVFVVEKTGRIRVITNLAEPAAGVFLDLSGVVSTAGEQGLLGLAFHPSYAENGYFYVFYTTQPSLRFDRLSRFNVSASDPNVADRNSELVMINQIDEETNHNGGDLHFGADGYLYVALGDEGAANDSRNNSQQIDKDFFSGLLRIDVDFQPGSLAPNSHPASIPGTYAVPADNPFVGATSFNELPVNPENVRTEFWAVGLRNPWRFSFDPATNKLYCGDVGQGAREEIDVIERGGNYGWAFREGLLAGPKPRPPGAQPIDPIWDYPRSQGFSITGGVVYRGARIPELYGAYLFADYVSGRVWALWENAGGAPTVQELLIDNSITAFGTDPRNGDILLADLMEGQIKRLVAPVGPRPPYGLYLRGGSNFTNYRGYQEKYFGGTSSLTGQSDPEGYWYFILPAGDLYEFAPPYSNPALAGVLVAQLGAAYYNNPEWLTYSLFQRDGSYFTNYRGQQEKYFGGTASANGYNDPSGPWYFILPTGDLHEFTPPYSNPSLSGVLLARLGTTYYNYPDLLPHKLHLRGSSYFDNYRGQQEKYLGGIGSANGYDDPNGYWYYLVPNGDLYEFTPPYSNPVLTGVLVEQLGPAFYEDPSPLLTPVQIP